MVRTPPAERERWLTIEIGPGYETDYEPILARIAPRWRRTLGDRRPWESWRLAWHLGDGTSDAEVLKGVLDSLDSHEFVFAQLMALADALGCVWSLSSLLSVPGFQSGADSSFLPSRVTPKEGADSGVGLESQILCATTPSQARKQLMMLLLLIPQPRPRRRRCHLTRTRAATSFSNLNTRLTTLTRQGCFQKQQRIAYVLLDFSIIVDN